MVEEGISDILGQLGFRMAFTLTATVYICIFPPTRWILLIYLASNAREILVDAELLCCMQECSILQDISLLISEAVLEHYLYKNKRLFKFLLLFLNKTLLTWSLSLSLY